MPIYVNKFSALPVYYIADARKVEIPTRTPLEKMSEAKLAPYQFRRTDRSQLSAFGMVFWIGIWFKFHQIF